MQTCNNNVIYNAILEKCLRSHANFYVKNEFRKVSYYLNLDTVSNIIGGFKSFVKV